MKKRFAIVLLAVLLTLTGAPVAIAGSSTRYTDVTEQNWYYPYVTELSEQGVIEGYGDGTFRAKNHVTWGQSFKLILLATGCPEPETDTGSNWAAPYIPLAIENRLVYSFNSAYLNECPTRREVARMTARALDLAGISGESPYVDCDDGYVVELYEKGIMEGMPEQDGERRFYPDQTITRAEMAAIIWRVKNIDITEGMFRYNNYWLDVLEGVPESPFTPEQFSRDEKNRAVWSEGYYALGIDVSGHKGNIDWNAVADDGIEFAIVRAGNRGYTQGTLFEDSYFHRNIQGALDAGLDVGAYFFSNAITPEEALEEADLFLSMLEPYHDQITYPVVCDWEYLGGNDSRAYGVDAEIITKSIIAFCERVAEAGYTPMVYFNGYCGYVKMDLSDLLPYEFWYAQYSAAPDCIYDFQMWQYSSSGKVAGIRSDVDMNICFVPYGQPVEPEPPDNPEESDNPDESGNPDESQPVDSEQPEPQPSEDVAEP